MQPLADQLRGERDSPTASPPLYSINLSGASVCDRQLVDFIAEQLRRYNFPAGRLCFEISEATVLHHLSQLTQFAHTLKDLGCQLAIDDFGAHRFLKHLPKQLPINYFKLHGDLVQATPRSGSKLRQAQEIYSNESSDGNSNHC